VIYRALEREPKNRYATAHDVLWDLEHLDQVGVQDRPEIRDWDKRKSQTARKILYYGLLALIPVAVLLVMYIASRHH
jgi:predicted nucleic acid-binding Zn ribbon protein